jgi:hypothetical protein
MASDEIDARNVNGEMILLIIERFDGSTQRLLANKLTPPSPAAVCGKILRRTLRAA